MQGQLAQVGVTQVHVEGAGRGAAAAGRTLGRLQAALVVDDRHARAAEAGEKAHERRDGAEPAAPFAQEYQLNDKHGRHEQKRPVQVARAEQAHQQGHRCESEAHGAHEAEHGEPEHGRRQQRAAKHRMTRVQGRVALGVAGSAGGAVVSRRRLFQRCDLLGGEGLVRLREGLRLLLARFHGLEELLHSAPQGHGADPAAEQAAQKQHEGDGHHDAQHRTRDEGLGRHHG